MALLIGYDLYRGNQQEYEDLFKFLKSEGPTWHYLDSTWMVVTTKTPVEMRDAINEHIDSKDKVLVVDVTGCPAAWHGFSADASDWIKKNKNS